ncbi:MAG: hypothetical protein V5A62_04690 [Haloarculaceae archaeon]
MGRGRGDHPAATIAVASTGAYPWLPGSSSRARLTRAGFKGGGLAVLLAVVTLPTVVESGFYRYPVVLGLAALLVVLDGLPLVSELGMG